VLLSFWIVEGSLDRGSANTKKRGERLWHVIRGWLPRATRKRKHETENEQTQQHSGEKREGKKRKKAIYPAITGKETYQSPEGLRPTPSLRTLHFLESLLPPDFIL